jgi:hypothetical protein
MGAAASESQGETARGSQEFSYVAEFFNIVRDHRAFPCSGAWQVSRLVKALKLDYSKAFAFTE